MKTMSESVQKTDEIKSKDIIKIVAPYALFGGTILIVYFLLMRFLGYYQQTGLRAINAVLMIPVIYFAIKAYIRNGAFKSYLMGMCSGIITYLISYGILSMFMFLYLLFADNQLMAYIHDSAFPEMQLNPLSVAGILMGEGLVAAVLTSYLLMQNFKDDIRKAA